jgi:hypothetical protein
MKEGLTDKILNKKVRRNDYEYCWRKRNIPMRERGLDRTVSCLATSCINLQPYFSPQ